MKNLLQNIFCNKINYTNSSFFFLHNISINVYKSNVYKSNDFQILDNLKLINDNIINRKIIIDDKNNKNVKDNYLLFKTKIKLYLEYSKYGTINNIDNVISSVLL